MPSGGNLIDLVFPLYNGELPNGAIRSTRPREEAIAIYQIPSVATKGLSPPWRWTSTELLHDTEKALLEYKEVRDARRKFTRRVP
jgi:hypothetical protein